MPGTYTNLLFHVVFSTKNRLPLITRGLKDDLHRYIGGIVRGLEGDLLEIGGTADHVHMLVKLKPKLSLSTALMKIKANSSKWANETHPRARKFGWQDGFAAFTVSESQAARVRRYIRNQEVHHRRQDFQAELRALLNKHRIPFEEQYLWD
jgi:REP element-mobilizing transposase RayT